MSMSCASSGDEEVFQLTRPMEQQRRQTRTETPKNCRTVSVIAASAEDFFVHPMNLGDPRDDLLGYSRVCSFQLREIEKMRRSSLNSALVGHNGGRVASFVVRLWSRSSRRYVSILSHGAAVYGRSSFGPAGHFRIIMLNDKVAMLQNTSERTQHLAVQNRMMDGSGRGGRESCFVVAQTEAGFCTFESVEYPGSFLGIRENGNLMMPPRVDPNSRCAHFLVQKEAMCVTKPTI